MVLGPTLSRGAELAAEAEDAVAQLAPLLLVHQLVAQSCTSSSAKRFSSAVRRARGAPARCILIVSTGFPSFLWAGSRGAANTCGAISFVNGYIVSWPH